MVSGQERGGYENGGYGSADLSTEVRKKGEI